MLHHLSVQVPLHTCAFEGCNVIIGTREAPKDPYCDSHTDGYPAAKRIDVKVICENGDYWCTGINATLEGAQEYFMGRFFRIPSKVVKVELIGHHWFSLINVQSHKGKRVSGAVMQHHYGTLETAKQLAKETMEANSNKIEVALTLDLSPEHRSGSAFEVTTIN